jgi:hypothetical protein
MARPRLRRDTTHCLSAIVRATWALALLGLLACRARVRDEAPPVEAGAAQVEAPREIPQSSGLLKGAAVFVALDPHTLAAPTTVGLELDTLDDWLARKIPLKARAALRRLGPLTRPGTRVYASFTASSWEVQQQVLDYMLEAPRPDATPPQPLVAHGRVAAVQAPGRDLVGGIEKLLVDARTEDGSVDGVCPQLLRLPATKLGRIEGCVARDTWLAVIRREGDEVTVDVVQFLWPAVRGIDVVAEEISRRKLPEGTDPEQDDRWPRAYDDARKLPQFRHGDPTDPMRLAVVEKALSAELSSNPLLAELGGDLSIVLNAESVAQHGDAFHVASWISIGVYMANEEPGRWPMKYDIPRAPHRAFIGKDSIFDGFALRWTWGDGDRDVTATWVPRAGQDERVEALFDGGTPVASLPAMDALCDDALACVRAPTWLSSGALASLANEDEDSDATGRPPDDLNSEHYLAMLLASSWPHHVGSTAMVLTGRAMPIPGDVGLAAAVWAADPDPLQFAALLRGDVPLAPPVTPGRTPTVASKKPEPPPPLEVDLGPDLAAWRVRVADREVVFATADIPSPSAAFFASDSHSIQRLTNVPSVPQAASGLQARVTDLGAFFAEYDALDGRASSFPEMPYYERADLVGAVEHGRPTLRLRLSVRTARAAQWIPR